MLRPKELLALRTAVARWREEDAAAMVTNAANYDTAAGRHCRSRVGVIAGGVVRVVWPQDDTLAEELVQSIFGGDRR